MLRLTNEQWSEAVQLATKAIEAAEEMGLKAKLSRGLLVVETLGDRFDISDPRPTLSVVRDDLPLACDEADDAIERIWADAYEETERANQLFDWVQGRRP